MISLTADKEMIIIKVEAYKFVFYARWELNATASIHLAQLQQVFVQTQ
jgi:hypothetical protein